MATLFTRSDAIKIQLSVVHRNQAPYRRGHPRHDLLWTNQLFLFKLRFVDSLEKRCRYVGLAKNGKARTAEL